VLILDTAIIWVAMPSIGRVLALAPATLSWLANGYSLTFGGFLLLGGRLADLVGRRRLFRAGLVAFSAASLVGALAGSPAWLLGARAAQGLAAAVVAPASMSLMMVVFPDRTGAERARRGKAFAVWQALGALGGSAGFFLGGVLTQVYGWPSVFAINVPIGLVAAFLAARLLPESRGAERPSDFDVAGAVVGTAGLALAVYVLVGTSDAGWASARTVGLGTLAAALTASFLVIQRVRANPLIPLRIFRSPALASATVSIGLANMAIVPMVFFLSLHTQRTLGFSPFVAGLTALPLAISIATSSTVAARLLRRFGVRAVAATGFAAFTVGLLWLSRVSGGSYLTEVFGPEIVIGIGAGMTFVAATVAGTARAPEDQAGIVASVFCVSQQVGGVLGLAVLTAVATAYPDLVGGVRMGLLGAALFTIAGLLSAIPLPGHSEYGPMSPPSGP